LASALAGIALERIVKPAVKTKAEPKNASFFIERLLWCLTGMSPVVSFASAAPPVTPAHAQVTR
jgi:hypothetical protein